MTAPRTILWRIALLALLARAALEVVGLTSAAMHHQPVAAHLLGLWWQWDAHPYLRIAQIGYRARSLPGRNPFDQYYLGFFPFYPMTVKAASLLLRNRVLSGLVVSYVASVFASWFLYLLVRIEGNHEEAWRAVLLLLTFPTAYFLSAPYSEALFLFGVTGSVYAARTARWGRAGFAGAVATGTRLQGLVLLPALLAEAFRGAASRTARIRRVAWAALASAGFAGFLVLSQVVAHDPFRYFTLQRTHWFQKTVPPWVPVTDAVGSLLHGTNSTLAFVFVTRLAAIAIAVPLLALAVRRLPVPDWIYGWAGFVPLLFTGWLTALPRFLLALYPLFIVSAQLTRSRRVFVPACVAGAALQSYLFWRFAAGEWTF